MYDKLKLIESESIMAAFIFLYREINECINVNIYTRLKTDVPFCIFN